MEDLKDIIWGDWYSIPPKGSYNTNSIKISVRRDLNKVVINTNEGAKHFAFFDSLITDQPYIGTFEKENVFRISEDVVCIGFNRKEWIISVLMGKNLVPLNLIKH